jgi:HAD superfamily hydrolase (TIGR01484 family)
MNPAPLSQLPRKTIKAVFSDLDDTLTDNSLLLPSTLESLHALKSNGFKLVIVSGRPAGWADSLMRLIPLDAVIFENGAGMMWKENEKIYTHCLAPTNDSKQHKIILQECFEKMRQQIPEIKLATDQPYRLFDYAIDFNEEPPRLSSSQIDWIMEFLEKDPRLTAKLSSIHINYWVGKHTKLTACEYWLKKFGEPLGVSKETVAYSGDSPNDEPLFGYFPNSVGVANVRKYLNHMVSLPKYMTSREAGLGFQELVKFILEGTLL